MKKQWLILPIFILILTFTLLPTSFLSANPGNLVTNGDFSDGSNNWSLTGSILVGEEVLVAGSGSYVYQLGISSPNKDLIYSVDIYPITFVNGGSFDAAFILYNGANYKGIGASNYNSLPTGTWSNISFKISNAWGKPLPEFDTIEIWLQTWNGCQILCDNFSLEATGGGGSEAEPKEEIWVRNHEMECWQVWVNQDNAFEFVFVWEYANNNHVQIFDMAGNLVFETDMQKGNTRFVAALPDGMYTVKTFHESGHILQEFVIGKP